MDRIYVKHHHKACVHDLGLELWRDIVLRQPAIKPRFLSTLLSLVKRERGGEVIDRSLMRTSTLVSNFCWYKLLGPANHLAGSFFKLRGSLLLACQACQLTL